LEGGHNGLYTMENIASGGMCCRLEEAMWSYVFLHTCEVVIGMLNIYGRLYGAYKIYTV
jgi:hypothetical protein